MTKSLTWRGDARRAWAGGHRFYVRTGEYADGTLGEVQVLLPRDGPALRGMMEAPTAAVSLGLQHGVALQDHVAASTLTRFRPAGALDGDPDVAQATSILGYVSRPLASRCLGGCLVPEAEPERTEPAAGAPLLPLDSLTMPRGPRPRLRLVAAR